MIFNTVKYLLLDLRFESSVKSYVIETREVRQELREPFESSVKSYVIET